MSQLDVRATARTRWSTKYRSKPGLTLEEVVRPYGVSTTLGFEDADGERATVTYDQFARRAAVAAARLRQQGVQPGEPVALTITNSLQSLITALGVWTAGSTLVSLPPPPRRGLADHLDRIGPVLTAMGCRHQVTPTGRDEVPPGVTAIPIAALHGDEPVSDPEPTVPDVALVQFTSGSRGTPKGVAISREAFTEHIRMIITSFEAEPARDRMVTWLPMYHDLGFVACFGSAFYGRIGQFHIDPRAFVLNPSRWLTTLAQERATLSAAPNFGYRLASRVSYPEGMDLSRMRASLNAAERVLWSDLEAFHRAAGPCGFDWGAIMPAYGLAEGTVGVTANMLGKGPVLGPDGHVSVGVPLPGNVIDVVGGTRPGTLFLDGDWLFEGYWTATGFQPRPAGPFDTNDAAFLHNEELFVIGRQAEVASVGGHNIFAEDVEAAAIAADVSAVVGCAAFKHDQGPAGERFGLVLEVSPRSRKDAAEIARAVRAQVTDATGARPSPLLVVQSGVIPRTSSGKPQRGNLRQACLAGELPKRRVFETLA